MRTTRTVVTACTIALTLAVLRNLPAQDTPSRILDRAARKPAAKSRTPQPRKPAARPVARWIGQDAHDVVGPSPAHAPAPSDVQDIHIELAGLPAGKAITVLQVTALGGAEWRFNGPYGPWRAEVVRKPGETFADLFLEPTQAETGRPFAITIAFDDGSTLPLECAGGRADPNLRMPGKSLSAAWIGQDGRDVVGQGPSVGPDGLVDVRIELKGLSAAVALTELAIDAAGDFHRRYGVNPEAHGNAELVRPPNDASRGHVHIQPDRDLAGKPLTIVARYANGKADKVVVKGGKVDLKKAVPAARVDDVPTLPLKVRWIGQTGETGVGPNDVKVIVEGLPRGVPVAATALSNAAKATWAVRANDRVPFYIQPYGLPMAFRPSPDGTSAEILFPPDRDESGSPMTLRLVFADGRSGIATFPGGKVDPALRAGDGPAATQVRAMPGDDLHKFVERFGTVVLAKGEYRLDRPLVLNRPIVLKGEPGAILQFAQNGGEPWTTALKIHAGRTTLEGFSIRFAGPIEWRTDVNYGPAVIGTTDSRDPDRGPLKAGISIRKLDVEGPPASGRQAWENSVGLMRLVGAPNGRIEGCTLKGGMIEFDQGPWTIVDNRFQGARPGTTLQAVFSGHNTHDLELRGNRTKNVGPSGKTWRFLVLTGSGMFDRVEGNVVEDIGPRDDDTVPGDNAPETILTEAYTLHFEGRPLGISRDGRAVRITDPQGGPAVAGDALTVLTGPEAGRHRRIVQAIDATTYLVDPPFAAGDRPEAISIAGGFVGQTYKRNVIDLRGGSVAVALVLVGNHYGTKILENRFIGGGAAAKITACPTEGPCHWGWSHAPFVGGEFRGNRLEDVLGGARFFVERGPAIKSSLGRTYMSAELSENLVSWSPEFERAHPAPAEGSVGLIIGTDVGPADPPAVRIHEAGSRVAAGRGIAVRRSEGQPPAKPRSARSRR